MGAFVSCRKQEEVWRNLPNSLVRSETGEAPCCSAGT
jgi:hypothetical protein